jgi:hypothetical protein
MSNPTTPFGWQMPTATDLVTDLPADFEVFGQAVATSMADLLGGTSGQVLAKNSNTDMDFVWVTSDDANAIQNTIVDAKGDLIGATASDTPARLAVGTNNSILTADSSTATGLAWTGNWISYTPTWNADITNPAIGNGSLEGGYRRIGGQIDFWIRLVAGSTTTFGSGAYSLGLPVGSVDTTYNFGYSASILDAGVAWYVNYYGQGASAGLNLRFYLYSSAGAAWQASAPFTFGNNDQVYVQGSYRVA